MKDKTYIIGLSIIVISFASCIVSFYLIVLGIPIFLIGAAFVFASTTTIKRKLISTITPLILYLPSKILFLVAYNYTSPKTILIPSNYEGRLRIVYEEKCGIKPRIENGKETLEFPKSGLLILNKIFDGGMNNNYYLVDIKGDRQKVNEISDFNTRPKNIPVILISFTGIIGGSERSTNKGEKGIKFSDFLIYQKGSLVKSEYESTKKFDPLTESLVKNCRMNN